MLAKEIAILQRIVTGAFVFFFEAVRPVAVKLLALDPSLHKDQLRRPCRTRLRSRWLTTPQHRYTGTQQLSNLFVIPSKVLVERSNFPPSSATHDMYIIFVPYQLWRLDAKTTTGNKRRTADHCNHSQVPIAHNSCTAAIRSHGCAGARWRRAFRGASTVAQRLLGLMWYEKASCRRRWLVCLR